MIKFKGAKSPVGLTLSLLLLIPLSEPVLTTATGKSSANARGQNPPLPAARWARYAGKGEEFTVSLPEPPSAHSKLRPILSSEQRPPGNTDYGLGRIYGAYADGVVYVIMSFDTEGTKEKLEDFVKEYRKYHRPESEMTFIRDVAQDDVHGKQYLIKVGDTDGVLQFYGTAKHIYVLQAVGGRESNPSIRHFLASFTLRGKPVAKGLLNPPGVAQASPTNFTGSPPSGQSSDPSNVFTSKEVTRKALVVARPEPRYPEQARRGNVTGRIIIRAVLSSSGKVDKIAVVRGLPGLAERAVEAVRNVKFIPAVKDGKFVSQYVTFEYRFGLF